MNASKTKLKLIIDIITTNIFTHRLDSSLTNKKFEKKPSIFKFINKNKIQVRIKSVCITTSLSIIGKLYFKLLIVLTLKSNWNKIETDKKVSGIKDFKTMISINY